jgi:hypothetical protein
MTVRIVPREEAQVCSEHDFVRVSVSPDPNDDTVTLATIQRVVDKSESELETKPKRYIKTLVLEHPMSVDAAIGFAACYAERKKIPVIYTEAETS